MAIQFPCVSCGQPIEIDDEWGGKTVACPFCHSRINAPLESQFAEVEQVPTASPVTPGVQDADPSVTPVSSVGVPESNRLAVVAVILAGLLLIGLITVNRIVAAHREELLQVQNRTQELADDGTGLIIASQKAWMEVYEQNGGVPPNWILAMVLVMALSGLVWLAALICAILALRKPLNRQFAVAALAVCGISPVVFCCCGGL